VTCDAHRAFAYLKAEPPDDGHPGLLPQGADEPILRPLAHGLHVAYVVDAGDRFQYVQRRDIEAAGLGEEQLHSLAVRNLAAFAERHAEVRPYGSIYVVLAGGNFEASVLLVDEFWTTWYTDLAPNGFIAAAPARDVLAFGDADSPAVLRELEAVIARLRAGPVDHPLTNRLLRRSVSGWEPREA
jgi:hypothetical protein